MKNFTSIMSGLLSFIMLVSPFSPVSRVERDEPADITEEVQEEENRLTVRVATYNIRNGGDVDHDMSIIAKDIIDNGVEIVGLQEVDNKTGRAQKKNILKELAEATGYEYYQFTSCIAFDGGTYGTGILSKYPIEWYETIVLPSDEHEQRKLGYAEININGVKLDFFNTHLSWESGDTRAKQFAMIAEKTAECDNFIVTGDFNTHNFDEFKVIEKATILNNEETRMVSCGEDGAIDNIIYSNTIRIVDYGMFDSVSHSDHYMIWADISIPIPETTTEVTTEE